MKKKVSLIIQARMGSTRLPGKSMMNLAGEPLVGRILERVKRCKNVDEIILAIPNTPENTPLISIGKKYNVTVFEGSENDVLDRYYQAAKLSKADIVGRLPADNPVPEPSEIDRFIDHHIHLDRPGFSSNLSVINNSGYPDGIGAEVFDFALLEEVWRNNHDPQMREHVHLNFYNYQLQKPVNNEWCPISTIECPKSYRRPDLILDVNTENQYQTMKKLYEDLYPTNPFFHITDVIFWYDSYTDS